MNTMPFAPTAIQGLYVVSPKPFRDARGFLARVFCEKEYHSAGWDKRIVQVNHSLTTAKGAIRGMHYQRPPKAEVKIVRCLKGRVFDVAVDLREGSATFLQWHGVELSADQMNSLYIPQGFAHGFQTLEPNCELLYLHSEFYSPAYESALRWDDPAVGIRWPLPATEISAKDKAHPLLTKAFKGVRL
jgi:dTDP-4-dehydrorhamnose 3,5-epimerase